MSVQNMRLFLTSALDLAADGVDLVMVIWLLREFTIPQHSLDSPQS